jgi:hypothetical protein
VSFPIDVPSKTDDAIMVPPKPSLRPKMNDGSSHPFHQPTLRTPLPPDLGTQISPVNFPDSMRPIMTGQREGNDPYIAHHFPFHDDLGFSSDCRTSR